MWRKACVDTKYADDILVLDPKSTRERSSKDLGTLVVSWHYLGAGARHIHFVGDHAVLESECSRSSGVP